MLLSSRFREILFKFLCEFEYIFIPNDLIWNTQQQYELIERDWERLSIESGQG